MEGFEVKGVWQHAEKLAALSALLLAVPAFILSLLSYSASHRALDLSEQDFRAARSLILKVDYKPETKTISLTPLGEGITLQTCRLLPPPSVSDGVMGAMSPSFEMSTMVLEQDLQTSLDKVPKPRHVNGALFPDRMLPVIIESVYLAKGEVHQARSVYDITFDVNILSDGRPMVVLKGSLFVSDASSLSLKELDALWNQQLEKMRAMLLEP